MIGKIKNHIQLNTLQRYVLQSFLSAFFLCLFAAVSLFVVFDLFERMRTFVREGATVLAAVSYITYKIPLIVQLMTPVAVLIATLFGIGRLSRQSEITAMRACGVSIVSLAKPLLYAGFIISALMFVAGESIIPIAAERVEEIYQLDIKKKIEKGSWSRANFWFRSENQFYNVGYYDSRSSDLKGIAIFEFDDDFVLKKRIDAREASWQGAAIGWTMKDVIEKTFDAEGKLRLSRFEQLPLVIDETPKDFYNRKREPETMSYVELGEYIEKLQDEGVPVTNYLVDRAAKIAFPFVNMIVVLIAFPFALTPARSGTMTLSFIAGVSIGFGYHVVHAISTSLGAAELIPITSAAWTANILLGCLGGYLMAGAEEV